MHLSRIVIENFLNFQSLDVALGGNLVIVGENIPSRFVTEVEKRLAEEAE